MAAMRRMLRSFRARLSGRTLALLATFFVLSAGMLLIALGATEFRQSLGLNLASEFIGAFVVIYALNPLLQRAQHGRVREHRRLDFDLYTDRVLAASHVRILHSFSRLFLEPFNERFLRATDAVLARGGRVQVLLLHPDSAAARQRTTELGGRDVAREVRRNLQVLGAHWSSLDGHVRPQFEVRLYTAAPSVLFYQWDGKLLTSFYPVGKLAGDSTQLEVSSESPLGYFVTERFDELWRDSTSIEAYMELKIRLRRDEGETAFSSRYVAVGGAYYVADQQLVAHLAHGQDVQIHVASTQAAPVRHTASVIIKDAEPRMVAEVNDYFYEKYLQLEDSFVRLSCD